MPSPTLTAYIVGPTDGWSIVPASPKRDWMDETPGKGAYRCLPLAMANQLGWVITCPFSFRAVWSGDQSADATVVTPLDNTSPIIAGMIQSHFGGGIITFRLPWLFRTSPGFGLIVRGPTNLAHPDAAPLDGLVETDWSPATFTMNWKLLRPGVSARFNKGDPICMVTPYPLDLIESFDPVERSIDTAPNLKEEFLAFSNSRNQVLSERATSGRDRWEKDYMKGERADGSLAPNHRTNLKLKSFAKPAGE